MSSRTTCLSLRLGFALNCSMASASPGRTNGASEGNSDQGLSNTLHHLLNCVSIPHAEEHGGGGGRAELVDLLQRAAEAAGGGVVRHDHQRHRRAAAVLLRFVLN